MLNAWQVEIMEQDARLRKWEEINEPEPDWYQEAAGYISAAIKMIDQASAKISDAESILTGSPDGSKLGSLNESLATVYFELQKLVDWR